MSAASRPDRSRNANHDMVSVAGRERQPLRRPSRSNRNGNPPSAHAPHAASRSKAGASRVARISAPEALDRWLTRAFP